MSAGWRWCSPEFVTSGIEIIGLPPPLTPPRKGEGKFWCRPPAFAPQRGKGIVGLPLFLACEASGAASALPKAGPYPSPHPSPREERGEGMTLDLRPTPLRSPSSCAASFGRTASARRRSAGMRERPTCRCAGCRFLASGTRRRTARERPSPFRKRRRGQNIA